MALQPHSLVRHQLRVDDNGSLVQIEKKVITRVEVRQTGQKHAVSATGNQSKKTALENLSSSWKQSGSEDVSS